MSRLSEFVEHLVAPAVVRLFRAQGIEMHAVYPGVSAHRDGERLEIDLLVVNEGALVGLECKSKLTLEHVDAHTARLAKLKRVLPLCRDHRVMEATGDVSQSAPPRHGREVLAGQQTGLTAPQDP